MTVINTNTASINAQLNLSKANKDMETSMAQLSSGKRINSAADDAAGLSIATRMESQIRGLQMTVRNANDGMSLVSSVEGTLQESTNILQRMHELSVQASNSTYNDIDRAALQDEMSQLQTELDRIANDTEFNGQKVVDGSFTGKSLNVGMGAGGNIAVNIGDHSSSGLSAAGTKDAVATLTSSASAIAVTVGTANELFQSSEVQNAEVFADDQGISREVVQINIGNDESQKVVTSTVSDIVAASTVSAAGLTAVSASATSFDRANQIAGVIDNDLISVNEAGSTAGADGVAEVRSFKVDGRVEHKDVLSFEIEGQTGVEVTVGAEHFGATDFETKTNALNALVEKFNNNLTGENVDAAAGVVELSLQMLDGDHYIVATASNPSDTQLDFSNADGTDGLRITNTDTSMTAADLSAATATAAANGSGATASLTIADAGAVKVGDDYKIAIADGGTFEYEVTEADIGANAAETLENLRNSIVDGYNDSGLNFSEASGVITASLDPDTLSKITLTGSNATAGATFDAHTGTTAVPKATNDETASVTETTDATIVAGTATGPLTSGKAADTASVELVVNITDHDAGDVLEVSFGGHTFTHTIDEGGTTDSAGSVAAALVGEINDRMPELEGAGAISASSSGGVITLTAENAGADGDFEVSVETRNAEAVAMQGVVNFEASDGSTTTATNALNVGEEVTLSFGTNNSVSYTVTAEVAAMDVADANKEVVEQLVALGNAELQGVTLRVDPSAAGGDQIIYESTVPGNDPGYVENSSVVSAATASARVNSVEFSGYIGQGDSFTIADAATSTANSVTVSATSAIAELDTNDERRTAMRDAAYDALVADSTIDTAYTIAKVGDFGLTMEANTAATDFDLVVSSTNSSLAKQAKVEQLTLSGSVQQGDTYSIDFGDGNVASYTATAADVDGKSGDEALSAVRDGLMVKAAETGLVTAEAVDGDKIQLTAAVAGVDFRAVASATNAASVAQVEEVAIGNVEAGDGFAISIGNETLSYIAEAGDGAEDVASWMADNAAFSGISVTANGSSLMVQGEGGAEFAVQTQATNFAGGIQEQTMSIAGSMDNGDVYTVEIDGQSISTAVQAGDTQADVASRIAENLNANAGDKVAASVNDDGTIKIASAAEGITFAASVSVSDVGRSNNTVAQIDISTEEGAAAARAVLEGAISQVNETRSELGAISNRLDHTISNLGNVIVNTEASQSRIEDADFAKVTGELTKSQIMSQAATAMLAQANASKQGVLSLLQG